MAVVANVAVNLDARNATQNAARFKRETDGVADSVKKLDGRLRDANGRFIASGRAAATATANVQRFGIAFRSVVGPLVAVTGAVTLLSRSLTVLGERQADAAALENGLKKLGGRTADLIQLQKTADLLGKQTLFNQEDFDRGFALLTSFQSIAVGAYERVATAAADVAQITKQDLNSSLLQLAKALQDPEKGLTALARSGTTFTQSQKDQIKELVKSGDLLKAQDLILREIEKQYGNAAKTAGSAGYAGAVDSLQESFRDFQERLAKGVEPAVNGTLKALTDLFDLLNKIPEPVGKAALGIAAVTAGVIALKAAAAALIPVFKTLLALALANPWVALAAGITAATVALAGYRNESQKIADAARTGGPLETVAARKQLSDTEAQISLLKLERKDASSRERARIDRDLAQLRKDSQELRDAIKANEADIETEFALPSLDISGDGAGAGDKLAKQLQDQIKAGLELGQQFQRNIELRTADSDLQRNLLQVEYDRLDAIKEIQETAAIKQQSDLITLANADFELQKRDAIKEATRQTLDSAKQLVEKFQEEAETQKQIEAYIKDGVNPELAKQLVEIDKQFETQRKQLTAMEGILTAELARVDANSETAKELERQLKALKGIQAELDGVQQETKDNTSENDKLTKEQEKQKKLYEDIYGIVSSELTNGIQGLIEGTKTLNEIASDLLSALGNLFLSLAFDAIKAPLGAALGIPGFAEGGYVTSPTQATVGEGGSSEYIVPSSKMDGAMQRWNQGMRGDAVVSGAEPTGGYGGVALADAPTNITIEGGVLNFNDSQYIRQDQVPSIVKQASAAGEAQALRKLQMSTATRKRLGL